MLGIRCKGGALTGIDFLPGSAKPEPACCALSVTICAQLLSYLENPLFQFSVPLKLQGSAHQLKVWHALSDIRCGQTRSYGELAHELKSSAQAVGQACGSNPIPVIIPCHRVVSRAGLGGFMRCSKGDSLKIKHWLLVHEGASA